MQTNSAQFQIIKKKVINFTIPINEKLPILLQPAYVCSPAYFSLVYSVLILHCILHLGKMFLLEVQIWFKLRGCSGI